MKSNLSLLLPISFYTLFPFFFCVLLFPSKSSLKSCLVQLTGLFQQIIFFHFLKKQKVDLLSTTEYQAASGIYRISAAACAVLCSSPFHTTGGPAPSPGCKPTRLLELCSQLSCRHWYSCNQLNEHALLRKLSKVNQCEKTSVIHPGHRHPLLQQAESDVRQGLGQHAHRHASAPQLHTRGIKPVMLEA